MAIIRIRDMIIDAKHGVHEHEKQNAQRFSVSVEVTVDTADAGRSDDLSDTLDWSGLKQKVTATVRDNSFNLIERLVQEVADQVLLDQRVEEVVVTIEKLDAFDTGAPGIRLDLKRA